MLTQSYSVTPHPIETLLTWVKSGAGDIVDTDLLDSSLFQSEAISQVVSQAKEDMVALPGPPLYSTQLPACLWFLAKNKNADAKRGFRDHRKQNLFIDARKLATLIDRVHRELTDADLGKITSTYSRS